MKRFATPLLALVATAVVITGCVSSQAAEPEATEASASTSGFPVTVQNCGREVRIEAAPERILLINNDAIPLIASLGALDRVVGLTSELLEDVYDEEIYTALAGAEQLATEKNSTGGSVVTPEAVLALEPDLVIGGDGLVDQENLAAAGIAAYSPPAYCATPDAALEGEATFDGVYEELDNYGKMLGETDAASAEIDRLKTIVDGLGDDSADLGSGAALYVSTTGVLSAYGASSMITPLFTAVGLSNVYVDEATRVFDISAEDLLARDPRTVVLLYSGSSAEETLAGFRAAPGVDSLSAVKEDRVLVLPFPFTDPPTPMSIDGAERLAGELATLK